MERPLFHTCHVASRPRGAPLPSLNTFVHSAPTSLATETFPPPTRRNASHQRPASSEDLDAGFPCPRVLGVPTRRPTSAWAGEELPWAAGPASQLRGLARVLRPQTGTNGARTSLGTDRGIAPASQLPRVNPDGPAQAARGAGSPGRVGGGMRPGAWRTPHLLENASSWPLDHSSEIFIAHTVLNSSP